MSLVPIDTVNYDTGHDYINNNVRYYLAHYDDEENCICSFLHMMQARPQYQILENNSIIPIIKDYIQNATWKTKRDITCGNYNPFEPDRWLEVIYIRYDLMFRAIQNAENMIRTLPIMKDQSVLEIVKNADPEITQDVIDIKDQLPALANDMQAKVEAADTPFDIVNLIEKSWNYTYNTMAIYNALEYCIMASENHEVHPNFSASIRNLGYTLAPLYNAIDEK